MNWDGTRERRRHRRAPIRIVSEFAGRGEPVLIETANLSAGGFSCWMSQPIQALTKLALRFEFPGFGKEIGRQLACEAIVVRCEKTSGKRGGWSMAAAFVALAPEDQHYIERYVAWHELVMAPSLLEEDGCGATGGVLGSQG